jgi:kinesin family protein 6/9
VSDPNLLIRRYELEIKQLKQELAMHDTLANRGRITYSDYSQEETVQIQKTTGEFLDGSKDNIGDIDSLRKVREVF